MSAEREPIVRLRFGGGRYGDCALDETALREVLRFQKIAALTAEALWRRRNPDRQRLPRGFQERTALRLCALEQGSAVAAFDAPGASVSRGGAEPELAAIPVEAAGVIHGVFGAVARGEPPPEESPKSLLADYARLSGGLANGETLEIALPDAAPAPVARHEQTRLRSFLEKADERDAEAISRVMQLDVRKRQFNLWTDEKRCIPVQFNENQESDAIAALRAHDSTRFRVRGRGNFLPDEEAPKIIRMHTIIPVRDGEPALDSDSCDIMTAIDRIVADIPDEVWETVPRDLSERHDYYIHGVKEE